MAGIRPKIARQAREQLQQNIVAWIHKWGGTRQALCKRLDIAPAQLHSLIHEGAERCSLEYLLDIWQRCGGSYELQLLPARPPVSDRP